MQYAAGGERAVAFQSYKLYIVLVLFVPVLLSRLTIETKWRQQADICMAVISDEERQEGKNHNPGLNSGVGAATR